MLQDNFRDVQDVLWKKGGDVRLPDCLEQTARLLLLKNLGCLEQLHSAEAQREGRQYQFLIAEPYRWENWAAPIGGRPANAGAHYRTGDDLRDFVNEELIPYFQNLPEKAEDAGSLARQIPGIFSGIKHKIGSGHEMRQAIGRLSPSMASPPSEILRRYDSEVMQIGRALGNLDEIFTPPALLRAIVQVIQPEAGETIYNPAAGTADFFSECWTFLQRNSGTAPGHSTFALGKAFHGAEKRSFAHVFAFTRMMLQGFDTSNLIRVNPLGKASADVLGRGRFDLALAQGRPGARNEKRFNAAFQFPRTGRRTSISST